jgi:hypothetical protein
MSQYIPQPAAWSVLGKGLEFKQHRLQLVQKQSNGDEMKQETLCEDMIKGLEVDETFGDYLVFTDEATFYLSRKVKKNNVRVFGTEHPHITVQVIRDSSKVHVFLLCQRQKCVGLSLRKPLSVLRHT